jgi:2-polyprenyl-3-methyl-5-hydroxy-6-metoxy-1,4-benzoquinol methylase
MENIMQTPAIDEWIADVRNFIQDRNPSLSAVAEVYISEAKFGRKFIDADIRKLANGAELLEIGAGSLILSSQLVREGYLVTALEPIGVGFSHFNQLQKLILELATIRNFKPNLLSLQAENLEIKSKFDLAFSINVMEHVCNVEVAIEKITDALKPSAYYRFTCPNYSFPYEPHFNLPTFVNKKITQLLLGSKIYASKNISDPKGVWESLNWISVSQLELIIKKLNHLEMVFNKKMLADTFKRLTLDDEFSSRRSAIIITIAKIIIFLRLDKLMQYVPMTIQPIIDCTIKKNN